MPVNTDLVKFRMHTLSTPNSSQLVHGNGVGTGIAVQQKFEEWDGDGTCGDMTCGVRWGGDDFHPRAGL